MFNIYLLHKYVKSRQEELWQESHQARLLQPVEGKRLNFWPRLTWKVGNWLILWGYKLQGENPCY